MTVNQMTVNQGTSVFMLCTACPSLFRHNNQGIAGMQIPRIGKSLSVWTGATQLAKGLHRQDPVECHPIG